MSHQCSAGHNLRKLASSSAFAGPILFMYFLIITFLALLKPFCAKNVFPHQAGITQCSPCFLYPDLQRTQDAGGTAGLHSALPQLIILAA